ncbi:MAG TPA: TonB-dependent receptor [Candidatus Eisenbacteria bacterium]
MLPLLLLGAPPARAQEKGSLMGRVTDKKSGHALAFASVTVVEAKRGVLTDSEGQYIISGLAPGTYEIRVQFLGYGPESRPGVKVEGGRPTTLNVQLQEIVVHEEKAVEVTAERRLVEVRQGATVRGANAAEIRNLPVQTVSDVLQREAGINTENDQIHVRGGRADETVFVVNGVANRDLVTGQSTAGQLNARSVAEVNVATGAYDVRYGNALSGVVEVTLKEGGDAFQGGMTMSSGSYGGRAFQGVFGGPDPLLGPIFARFGVPGTVSSLLDLSGSIYDTRYQSLFGDRPDPVSTIFSREFAPAKLRSSYEDAIFGLRFKYGSFFAPSEDNRWAGRYSLGWKPNTNDKLSFNFVKRIAIDQGFSRTFINATGDAGDPAYPWPWAKRITHGPTIFEDNVQTSLLWRRSLSHTGFTEFQVSRYFYAQRQDVQGKRWTLYEEPQPAQPIVVANGDTIQDPFVETGDNNTWQDRRTTSYGLQWSMTQRIKRHEIEFGIEHQFQTVQYVTIQNPWNFDPDTLGDAHDLWLVHPMVGDFYVRDRLEYEGFTANLGLRGDYWFVGREAEQAVADTANPNITPQTRNDFYGDTRSFFGRRYKLNWSPRLIVAHPITEHSSFFFNYGMFTQFPSYRYVYSKLTSVSSESFPLLGNPDLNPQVSINYELGGKHQFLPTAAFNATFFVKDIYDYPSATQFNRLQGASLAPFFVYLNGHFARSRGFELEVEKRRSHFWSGKVTYTFQRTRGKSSDPNAQKVVQENGGDASETPLSETSVSWNRPQKLAVTLDLRFDDGAPERWGLLKHSGVNVYVEGQSGRAYTPLDPITKNSGEPFSRNAPFQTTTDVRLNRWFLVGKQKFDFSLSGLNIFNTHEIYRVDPVTGKGRVWGVGSYDPRYFPTVNQYTKITEVDDPSNYGPGAQWRLQVDYDF